MNANRRE